MQAIVNNKGNSTSQPHGNPAPDELARRKAGARRTAWIIAAIAIAFFIASLLHGHFVGIPNWVPTR